MATYKGFFRPINIHKYKGDPTRIVYRSRWELVQMQKFDTSPDVLEWSSERVIVPYTDASTGRYRRYYPDFVIKVRGKDGVKPKTIMIEIKPKKETRPPRSPKNVSTSPRARARYITEVKTFYKNVSKWEAAKRFCSDRGWDFVVMTEDHLNLGL